MPSAFIFDLDGTLVDTEEIHFQAYKKAFATLNYKFERREYIDYWLNRGLNLKTFFVDNHINAETSILRNLKKEFFLKIAPSKLKVYEGVEQFLKSALNRNIVLALASGSKGEEIKCVLEKSGLTKYFAHIVSMDDVAKNKPNPEIYKKVVRKLKIPKNKCLVFENAPNGLRSAKSAGLKCIIIPSKMTKNLDYGKADKVYNNFTEISFDDIVR